MSFKGSHSNPFPEAGQGNENPRQWGSVQIAGYQIECQIGRGGMATVYRAVQQSLGRQVAIKILAHSPEEDDEFAQRFKKEGRILARLLHPNIITIHDIGISENNQLFLSIEYLSGGTLGDRIKQGLSFDSAIQIVRAIAKALGYAHERGVIHRDVKPSNIMFRHDGTPVLTDFGVARLIESKTVHTLSGLTVGSPGYMSPEQAMGESATIQSDLYSLGVVFYEMLVGRRLYEAANPIAITLKHLHDPIPELPKQYAHLQSVLNKLLAKQSTDRYKNTDEFLEAIDAITLDNKETQPKFSQSIDHISLMEFTTGKIQGLLKKRLRWPAFALIPGLIIIAIVIFYFFGLSHPVNQGEVAEVSQTGQQLEQETAKAGTQKDQEEDQQQLRLQAEQFLAQAQANFQEGLLDSGLYHIHQGLLAMPNHPGLLALRGQVQARIVERQRHEEETRRLAAEKERQKAEQARQKEEETRRLAAEKERQKAEQISQWVNQYLAQASDYRRNGKYQDSLRQIEKGLALAPNHEGLLRLRGQVRAEWSAEQQRQDARRQAAKAAQAQRQTKPAAGSSQQESDATLKKLQEIKNAVDALDKSLSR